MAKITIEKNIPVVNPMVGAPNIYPFSSMQIGDSFEVGEYKREKAQSIYGCIYNFIKKDGNAKMKFVCRKTKDSKIRVWRKA